MNKYVVKVAGNKKNVSIQDETTLEVDGKQFEYKLDEKNNSTFRLKLNSSYYEVSLKKNNEEEITVYLNGKNYTALVRTHLQEKASLLLEQKEAKAHIQKINAPMPGMIVKVMKLLNEPVAKGESIMILEAMKMENEIRAPREGVIKSIMVSENVAVEKGALLFTIE